MGEPLPPVDESHRVLLSALETLRSTRTAQMALGDVLHPFGGKPIQLRIATGGAISPAIAEE